MRIMTEPENALTKQYSALVEAEGAKLSFSEDGISEIAKIAALVNDRMENIGARRLHTVMTTLLEDTLFELPDGKGDNGRAIRVERDPLGFMLLDPGPGDHDLLLRFETPFENRIGAIVSAMTPLAMLGMIWYSRRRASQP